MQLVYASMTDSLTMHEMMQRTPALSPGYFCFCLRANLTKYNSCCRNKQGVCITRPSCFIRWDLHPFARAFQNVTLPLPQPQSLCNQENTTTKVKLLMMICKLKKKIWWKMKLNHPSAMTFWWFFTAYADGKKKQFLYGLLWHLLSISWLSSYYLL